ncbi:hypothetical protein [Thalassococcus lentus]|uniref:Methyltransferase n=1 Tax=Thalassococcus lentus TaxID=1210524 RepID=A0ABT4XVM2_9RHOB|nr:hypothetical protein [Thalassococcus lentus]MDA7425996.1 hypothetical protein [Thalassococcus lentus]
MTQTLSRPELTLPDAEAALLQRAYESADVILEYGSGGSTVLASEMPGKTVFSVESDQAWAQMMRDWFASHPAAAGTTVDMIWSDIGATKEWGHPVDASEWRRFARYPLEVWGLKEFRQPDVVLVDGRFRQGCALATAFMTKKPVEVLFDDYVQRKHYHKVEDFLGSPEITGRMARFRVVPQPIPPEKLLQVIRFMQNP